MIPISKADAFREFDSWSKSSRVGINFGRRDAGVSFFLRRATLEVKESSLLIEVKGTSMSLLHFDSEVVFFRLTAEDVKNEFARLGLINPSFRKCIGVKFTNEDFCLIFAEE